MAFSKGHAKVGGRKRGSLNKATGQVKDLTLQALEELGGVGYLVQVGRDFPQAFLSLLGRLIPRDLNLSGEVKNYVVEVPAPIADSKEWERTHQPRLQ